jgi:hypothetical protein
MMKQIAIMCTLVLALATVANATYTWDQGASGYWSDAWTGGTNDGGSKSVISYGTVDANVNTTAPSAVLLIGGLTAGGGTLDMARSEITVKSFKSGSSEILGLGNGGIGVINLSAGTLQVGNGSADGSVWGTTGGQMILYGSASNVNYHGRLYLSDDGIVMAEALRRKISSDTDAQFIATGGSLYIGTAAAGGIYAFGLQSAGLGFDMGSALLNPGGYGSTGTMKDGNSGSKQDLFAKNGTLQFDITSASAFDAIEAWGKVYLNDPNGTDGNTTVSINLGYEPNDGQTFNVITTGVGASAGISGAVARIVDASGNDISADWTALVIDSSDDLNDVLQLTYIPEPATLALLAMGGSALLIRRKRS